MKVENSGCLARMCVMLCAFEVVVVEEKRRRRKRVREGNNLVVNGGMVVAAAAWNLEVEENLRKI